MTTDAAVGAASSPSGTTAGSPDAGSSAAAASGSDAVASATGASASGAATGPITGTHARMDAGTGLPAGNGTASAVVIGSAVPSMGAGAMFQAVFGLAVVIALVFACGWVARRLGLKPSTRRGGIVKVIGSAALGARERVVVVEVRDTWLVLGVAAGSVRRLHTLPADPTLHATGDSSAAAADAFGDSNVGDNARRATVTDDGNVDGNASRDALPSFQSALARQLKDRLHGFGRGGPPGGKD